eukprot:1226968-Amphidinium_carterae.1
MASFSCGRGSVRGGLLHFKMHHKHFKMQHKHSCHNDIISLISAIGSLRRKLNLEQFAVPLQSL